MRRLFAFLLFFGCALAASAQPAAVDLGALVDAAWQRDPRARSLDARRDELSALAEVEIGRASCRERVCWIV